MRIVQHMLTRTPLTWTSVQGVEAERAAAIIAALQQEAAEIKAEKERLLASQDQHLERERADKQRLAEQLQATEVLLVEDVRLDLG